MRHARPTALMILLTLTCFVRGEAPADCCPPAKDKPAENCPDKHGSYDPPPCSCPKWELFDLGGGFHYYYAEFYAVNCGSFEESGWYDQEIDLSPECDTNCIQPSRKESAPVKHFPGIRDYYKETDVLTLPRGKDGLGADHGRVLVDVNLPYIRFQPNPAKSELRFAKVFCCTLNLQTRHHNPNLENRTIYVAVEMKEPVEGATAPIVGCTPVRLACIPGKTCHAFHGILPGPQNIEMTIITPEAAP